jgi:uncharacterized membrane protein YdcZ (DUF606 family)
MAPILTWEVDSWTLLAQLWHAKSGLLAAAQLPLNFKSLPRLTYSSTPLALIICQISEGISWTFDRCSDH